MKLEHYLKNRLEEKKLLLMTHIVLGYPSLEESFEIVAEMVSAGVDMMELQGRHFFLAAEGTRAFRLLHDDLLRPCRDT